MNERDVEISKREAKKKERSWVSAAKSSRFLL